MNAKDLLQEKDTAIIFKAFQTRWEESADPIMDDISYHLTEIEAIDAAKKIDLEIGFYPCVEKITLDVDFEEEGIEEIDDLGDLEEYFYDQEAVWSGSEFKGKDITGSIIIEWSWEKYIGYARNLIAIGIAGEFPFHNFETETDLISGNEERTFRSNYSVLLTKEEIEEAADLREAAENELNRDYWKWNHFSHNPLSEKVQMFLENL